MKPYSFDIDRESDRILEYLEGALSRAEALELEEELKSNSKLHKLFIELKTVYEGMAEAKPLPNPSPKVAAGFYQALAEAQSSQGLSKRSERQARKNSIPLWGQLLAAAAIFCLGFFIDKTMTTQELTNETITALKAEVEQTKSLVMLSMMQQPSASTRIQAVKYSYDLKESGPDVPKALIHAMNYDSHINVRLAAAEALLEFAGHPIVRMEMIETLSKPQPPEIQLILIEGLVRYQEEKAVPALHQLLKQEELLEVVRVRANEGIEILL